MVGKVPRLLSPEAATLATETLPASQSERIFAGADRLYEAIRMVERDASVLVASNTDFQPAYELLLPLERPSTRKLVEPLSAMVMQDVTYATNHGSQYEGVRWDERMDDMASGVLDCLMYEIDLTDKKRDSMRNLLAPVANNFAFLHAVSLGDAALYGRPFTAANLREQGYKLTTNYFRALEISHSIHQAAAVKKHNKRHMIT